MHRRRLALGGVALLVLTALVVWWTDDGEVEVEPVARPADAIELRVAAIVDGDTIRAVPQQQHEVWQDGTSTRVRLLEIDAPERERRTEEGEEPAECFGPEATSRLTELVPVGSRVWAQLDREPLDDYDRVLAYLWNEDDVFVNVAMVEDGFATALLVEPNDRYIDDMRRAETLARSEERGLWGVCR